MAYPDETDAYLLVYLPQTLLAGAALSVLPESVRAAGATGTLTFAPTAPAAGSFAQTGAVTGTTTSRLEEVRGYNPATPYVVGQHGVTQVTPEAIHYVIDQINYVTQLRDLSTTYAFGYAAPARPDWPLAGNDAAPQHEQHPPGPVITPDRPSRPVLPDFYAVARAQHLGQLPGTVS